MTTIKATCPTCGDVDLAPADVTVTVARALGWSTYAFTCAQCSVPVRKAADDEVVALLTSAGVRVERLDIPAEFVEARALSRAHAPLTGDDLLDFHQWLDRVDDIVADAVGD